MSSKTSQRINPSQWSPSAVQYLTGHSSVMHSAVLWLLGKLSMASSPSSAAQELMPALCPAEALELRAGAVPAVRLFSLLSASCARSRSCSSWLPSPRASLHMKSCCCFLQYLWSMLQSCFWNRKLVILPLYKNISNYPPSVPLLSLLFQNNNRKKK